MIITYIRSSLLGSWETCQQKTFFVYNLGLKDIPNIKTEIGTVTHRVVETLAALKKAYQETGKYEFVDPDFGKLSYTEDQLFGFTEFSENEIALLNKERSDTKVFMDVPTLTFPHKRMGVEVVEELVKICFEHYKKKSPNEFQEVHYQWARNFTWLALENKNGLYDPRKRNIVAPEIPFDLEIEDPWAKINYLVGDKKIETNLRIKGTIDLVTKINDDTIEIVDWKTGQRLNWATGKRKEYEDLCVDKQLMLYYYAARRLFPDKHIIITIFFLRDGGPFTVCFDDQVIPKVKETLKTTLEEVKKTEQPKLRDYYHQDFMCYRLCTFFKNKIDGQSQCSHIMKYNKKHGLQKTIEKFKDPNFSIDHYNNPGE